MIARDPGTTRAAFLLAFLTLINVLNFADRFLMQGFAVDIIADLQLSNFQFTLLTGFVFTVFYTFMGLLMGALADRVHRPRLMAVGLFAWSALTAATGAVGSFLQIAVVRMFTGVGEATLTPAALGLLGDVFHQRQRAFAAGCYYLGAPIGIGGTYLIAGTLGAAIGWRNCFYTLGVLGVGLSLVLLRLHEPRAAESATGAATHRSLSSAIGEIRAALLASPALCLTIVGGILVILAQGMLVLDQLWLVQERTFSKTDAQNLAGAMFLAGGVTGSILGGVLADSMQARRAGGRLLFLAASYAIGVPVGCLYRYSDPAGDLFYACMFVGSVMVTIGYGPIFAIVQDLVAPRILSTMTAFLILCMTLLGTSTGNLFAGWLADFFKQQSQNQPLTLVALLGLLPWLLAIPCFHLAARLVERRPQARPA